MYLKKFIEHLGKLLPDNIYFYIFRILYSLKNPARRGSKTRFTSLGPMLFLAEDPDGECIYFCIRSRFQRYLFPDGVKRIQRYMELKYFTNDCAVKIGDVVLDIGSNIGEFAKLVADKAAHVYCIEPDPLVLPALRKNTDGIDNITILDVGVSDKSGPLEFYQSTEDADSSFFPPKKYINKIMINALSLDDLIAKYKIEGVNFIKLEAEGWEPEILHGGSSTIAACNRISVDSGPERAQMCTTNEVKEILIDSGFCIEINEYVVTGVRLLD